MICPKCDGNYTDCDLCRGSGSVNYPDSVPLDERIGRKL